MRAEHVISYLQACGEPDMAAEVEQMHNRLEAFSLGMDRTAIDCAVKAAEELTEQRDVLLAALRDLELGANTVVACYERNPCNFAAALSGLKGYAAQSRAAIARATGSAS